MPSPQQPPDLLSFHASGIPQWLRDMPRWSVWDAVWREKKGKYDKIPKSTRNPAYGISTNRTEQWVTFDVALATLRQFPHLPGLGFVLTGSTDIIALDLDHCVKDGVIESWAREIVDQLQTYTELSPSGNGLRLIMRGHYPQDWLNHDQGIECYSGNNARFVTFTGQQVAGTPTEVADCRPDDLQRLEATYAKVKETKATLLDLDMPEILDDVLLPDVAKLDMDYKVRDYLTGEHVPVDRSGALHRATIALYRNGLNDQEVFSVLANSTAAYETALDHRNQDPERALQYLWIEHGVKAKPKALSQMANADDFEDVSGEQGGEGKGRGTGENGRGTGEKGREGEEKGNALPPSKPLRYQFQTPDQFTKRKPLNWFFKGVLPKAELGVVFGESGAGKSFFTLDMVTAIATGQMWMGRKCKTPGTVAYICAEGAGGFSLRLQAYGGYHGIELRTIPLHVLGDAPSFLEKADIKDLVAALKLIPGLVLVVVDTLAQVTPGANENSGEDMGRALAHCRTLNQATGAMVLLVAHSGKDSTRGVRGWSGIKGALDVEICVEKVERNDGNSHIATVTKMKDGEGEGGRIGFKLESQHLGVDDDQEAITSCVVVPAEVVKKAVPEAKLKGVPKLVYDRAMELLGMDDGPVEIRVLIAACAADMPPSVGAKGKDRNPELVKRALRDSLAEYFDVSMTHVSLRNIAG